MAVKSSDLYLRIRLLFVTFLNMRHPEHIDFAKYTELTELVAEFDAGKMSRNEFQQRARALPTDLLLILSEILTAGCVFYRAAAGVSDSQLAV